MRGVDSAGWPNSNPPGGVAQMGLLITGIGSEFGVDEGGVEQKKKKRKWVRHVEEWSMKHAVRVDDF